ncbi:MAG: FMN-binding protein [Planctomycetia bacterium]|nr:FMN-binding protein [Planctomycetia bacterium]
MCNSKIPVSDPSGTVESAGVESRKRPSYLLQAWLVIFLSAFYAVILVTVQINLRQRIEDNQRQATYSQIPSLIAGADPSKTVELVIQGTDGKPARILQVFNAEGNHIGWLFPGVGQGFGDVISLIIGLDPQAETITGLFVLEQKETPGLGNFIVDEPFRSQFIGKSVSMPLTAKAGVPTAPHEIQALTGATISSKAVCDIVNNSIANYRASALAAVK